jgi:hypothetical protein
MLLVLQPVKRSGPDRLKRQPITNTTPQSTPSFDPIDPEEASQRTDYRKEEEEEVTGAVEEKREGGQESSGGRSPRISQK